MIRRASHNLLRGRLDRPKRAVTQKGPIKPLALNLRSRSVTSVA